MTGKLNIDKLTKDIMQQSCLEVDNIDLGHRIMKRVISENRRKRILQNSVICLLIFITVDTIVLLFSWLLGLNIIEFAFHSVNSSQNLLLLIEKLKKFILHNSDIAYILLLITFLMIAERITDLKSKLLRKKN